MRFLFLYTPEVPATPKSETPVLVLSLEAWLLLSKSALSLKPKPLNASDDGQSSPEAAGLEISDDHRAL